MNTKIEIKINDRFTLVIDSQYKRIPIPSFKLWVDALESGDYTQYSGGLMSAEDHSQCCCLGVHCKVIGMPFKEEGLPYGRKKIRFFCKEGGYGGDWFLPQDSELAGIIGDDGDIPEGVDIIESGVSIFQKYQYAKFGHKSCIHKTLADLNDSRLFSFKDIALIIKNIFCEKDVYYGVTIFVNEPVLKKEVVKKQEQKQRSKINLRELNGRKVKRFF